MEGRIKLTCTSLLFAEFIDKNDNAKGMDGLCSDEESVMIMNSESNEDKRKDSRQYSGK